MRIYLVIAISLLLFSCEIPSLETAGGTKILLSSTEDITKETAQTIVDRLLIFSSDPEFINYEIEGKKLTVKAVGVKDQDAITSVIQRDRMMKVTYAVPPSSYKPIAKYLNKYVVAPTTKLPYKPKSCIGLVAEKDKDDVLKLINSTEFETAFPEAGKAYFGIKKMEGKYALFIEDANSPAMTETMFEEIGAYRGKDPGEGQLSLTLKDEFADRIGKLTGNDSTYLLHIFHEQVYISKIIEPHITDPSFGMAGAFSTKDVMILSSLWNTENLKQNLKIVEMKQ